MDHKLNIDPLNPVINNLNLQIATVNGSGSLSANMVYLGILAHILSLDLSELEKARPSREALKQIMERLR